MTKWNHSICTDCWNKLNPDRKAIKTTYPEEPNKVECKGVHDDD